MNINGMLKKHKYVIFVFWFNFAIAFFAFIGIIIKNSGLFTLWRDYNEQGIPIMMLMNESIKSGNIWWNWNIDLGSDFIGATSSLYSLGSPFFWLTLLFPKNAYPYLGGWLYMIKYAVGGVTSYLYLSRFVKEKKYALIGSALYSFSGFQATNLVFNGYHDVVALFPLLLIGIEKITEENKKGFFAAAVFINAIASYYFFIQEVIFIIIYFLIKNGIKKWKNIRDCFVEGAIGVAMAAFFLLPALSLLLGNPRIGNRIEVGEWLNISMRYMLQMVRAFFFPAEMMGTPSCIYQGDWSSWSAYLPMIGVSLTVAYIFRNKKDWVSRMIVLLWIFCCIPLFNSIFNMFSSSNYHRWYFMLTLIMCLASVKVMENREQYRAVLWTFLILFMMCSLIAAFPWLHENRLELIYYPDNFYFLSFVGIAGIAVTFIIFTFLRNEKTFFAALALFVAVFGALTTGHMCISYQNNEEKTSQEYYDALMLNSNIETPDERYRFLTYDNTVTMSAPLCGTGSFLSTVNGSIFEFWESLGKERYVRCPEAPYGINELLSVRYEISSGIREDGRLVQMIDNNGKRLYVYEREHAIPIGSVYHTYMLKSEYDMMDNGKKNMIMLQTVVVPDEEEYYIKNRMQHYEGIGEAALDELVLERGAESSQSLKKKANGFEAFICCTKEGLAWFSVPFSNNWHAFVNGDSVKIINTNGMMAVPVYEGDNEIEFLYISREFIAGGLISLISLGIFLIYSGVISAGLLKINIKKYGKKIGKNN